MTTIYSEIDMMRGKMDRLDGIQLFLRVVEKGSFSAAAREAGIGQSAVSKQIAALEARFGAQLLLRTSRTLRLTDMGQGFYETALKLMDDYASLELLAKQGQAQPKGLVRVAIAPVFGRLYIVPKLPDFLKRYPAIQVETFVSDRSVNLIEDGIDLAIRHGDLADSAMKVRRLASSPYVTVGTPTYFERSGTPMQPSDLSGHACLGFTGGEAIRPWLFKERTGANTTHYPEGQFRTNDGEQIRAAVLAGVGMAHLPAWIVMPEIRSGALKVVLRDYQRNDSAISAVYPSRRELPTKVRVFLEFVEASLGAELLMPPAAV